MSSSPSRILMKRDSSAHTLRAKRISRKLSMTGSPIFQARGSNSPFLLAEQLFPMKGDSSKHNLQTSRIIQALSSKTRLISIWLHSISQILVSSESRLLVTNPRLLRSPSSKLTDQDLRTCGSTAQASYAVHSSRHAFQARLSLSTHSLVRPWTFLLRTSIGATSVTVS